MTVDFYLPVRSLIYFAVSQQRATINLTSMRHEEKSTLLSDYVYLGKKGPSKRK